MGALGVSMVATISSAVYTYSSKHDCSAHRFAAVGYQYAVASEGACHTTAQRATIQGALDHYMDTELNDTVCGLQCMKLSHGGDWKGYIVFGNGSYDWAHWLAYCQTVGQFGHCESGGKKYVPDRVVS